MENEEIKKVVRERYGQIASQGNSCGSTGSTVSCCGPAPARETKEDLSSKISKSIGYSDEELNQVPDGANLGLGCGNPLALASVKEGDVVVDLGSGAGFDSFLAADKVGKSGKVIGVDMTHEMLEKARANQGKGDYKNVEFRLGEIENLPIANETADIIISNCVINLSVDKGRVFQEAYRVLKPGGKLMISDIVLGAELPEFVKSSIEAYTGCVSGAMLVDDYLAVMEKAGFKGIKILSKASFPFELIANEPMAKKLIENSNIPEEELKKVASSIMSAKISAEKPFILN